MTRCSTCMELFHDKCADICNDHGTNNSWNCNVCRIGPLMVSYTKDIMQEIKSDVTQLTDMMKGFNGKYRHK